MFADELGEEFVRNTLAICGKYLYLSAQDQDVAYRDKRARSSSLLYASGDATSYGWTTHPL